VDVGVHEHHAAELGVRATGGGPQVLEVAGLLEPVLAVEQQALAIEPLAVGPEAGFDAPLQRTQQRVRRACEIDGTHGRVNGNIGAAARSRPRADPLLRRCTLPMSTSANPSEGATSAAAAGRKGPGSGAASARRSAGATGVGDRRGAPQEPLPARRARPAVMADVAKLAGVSHQTVSRVLHDSPHVRSDTRERVLDAMRKLEYRPNTVARALVMGRSKTLGVVSFDTTLYGPGVDALRHRARRP
jgi:hypothetical protein